jgi:hypothetical protein
MRYGYNRAEGPLMERLSHHHILLYHGDFDRLSEIYHIKKPTVVIRDLVRKHIEAVEARLAERENAG